MVDSSTGERIVVHVHDLYGSYIRISSYEDGGALEDIFDDEYYILDWKSTPGEVGSSGGNEYYFGGAADQVKSQSIIDGIII